MCCNTNIILTLCKQVAFKVINIANLFGVDFLAVDLCLYLCMRLFIVLLTALAAGFSYGQATPCGDSVQGWQLTPGALTWQHTYTAAGQDSAQIAAGVIALLKNAPGFVSVDASAGSIYAYFEDCSVDLSSCGCSRMSTSMYFTEPIKFTARLQAKQGAYRLTVSHIATKWQGAYTFKWDTKLFKNNGCVITPNATAKGLGCLNCYFTTLYTFTPTSGGW